jgi:uncharacterized CHY-type Zn-finger protein
MGAPVARIIVVSWTSLRSKFNCCRTYYSCFYCHEL